MGVVISSSANEKRCNGSSFNIPKVSILEQALRVIQTNY